MEAREFRNLHPLFGWLIAAGGLALLAYLTAETILEVGINREGAATLGILALFWFFGIVFSVYAAAFPLIHVSVLPTGQVIVRRRYPFRVEEQRFGRNRGLYAVLHEYRDRQFHRWCHARLMLPMDRYVDLRVGQSRSAAERVVREFNQALAQAQVGSAPPPLPR